MRRALGGYLLVFAVLALPWLRVADRAIPIGAPLVSQGDACLFTWVLGWVAHALATDPRRLFDANINFPAPDQLAGQEHFLSTQVLFAPIYALTGNALLGANLVVMLSYPVAAIAMNRLLVALALDAGPAWIGGLVYALGPLTVPANLHVLQYLGVYLPLVALCLMQLRQQPDARRAAVLGLTLAMAMLGSYYLAVILCVGGAIWAAAELLRREPRRFAFAWRATAVTAVVVALLLALSGPYLRRASATDPSPLGVMPADFRLYAPFMETPGVTEVFQLALRGGAPSTLMSPGALRDPEAMAAITLAVFRLAPHWWYDGLLLGLAASGVLALASRRPAGRAARRGLVLALAGAVLMLGRVQFVHGRPITLPFALLAASPARFFRFPWRFIVLAGFGTALLGAAGIQIVTSRLRPRARQATLAAIAGAVLVVRGLAFQSGFQDIPGETSPIYDDLARVGPGPLLELPLARDGQSYEWDTMIGSTRHWLPLVTGVNGYPPPHRAFVDRALARLPASDALDELVDLTHVRWLALRPPPDWTNRATRDALLQLVDVQTVVERGGWVVARIDRTPRRSEWFQAIAAGGVPDVAPRPP